MTPGPDVVRLNRTLSRFRAVDAKDNTRVLRYDRLGNARIHLSAVAETRLSSLRPIAD
jgi:hypothetical protein